MSCTITITGPGSTFCFEAELIKRVLRKEGILLEVKTNYEYDMTDADMEEARRRMKGDWGGGDEVLRVKYNELGKVKRRVLLIEDHQPWGG